MLEIKYAAQTVNQAVESGLKDRDASRRFIKADKYYVTVCDENGIEYEIRYFL